MARCWGYVVRIAALCTQVLAGLATAGQDELTVPYEPSHPEVVDAMLRLARVDASDVVYDLGCGDGRIVVAAVKKFGARRGVGVDLDPQRLREAEENAEMAGVVGRVSFINGDIMDVPFQDATVVTLYLLPEVNLELRPRLFQQLRPGARVVSHAFDMGEWEPDVTLRHPKARNKLIALWVIPGHAAGRWAWTLPLGNAAVDFSMVVEQSFQAISSSVSVNGSDPVRARTATLRGNRVVIEADLPIAGQQCGVRYEGTIEGDEMNGTQIWESGPFKGTHQWQAQRQAVQPLGAWRLQVEAPWLPAPSGVLRMFRSDQGILRAEYADGPGSAPQPIRHVYLWGASLRFEAALAGKHWLFRGFIEGDAMRGRVTLANAPDEGTWSATRVHE